MTDEEMGRLAVGIATAVTPAWVKVWIREVVEEAKRG